MREESEREIVDFLASLYAYHLPGFQDIINWFKKHDEELYKKIASRNLYKEAVEDYKMRTILKEENHPREEWKNQGKNNE